MGLTTDKRVRTFIFGATAHATPRLASYSPQAIANICWVLGRLDSRLGPSQVQVVAAFSSAAVREATVRECEFSWQDASGIVSGLMRAGSNTDVSEVRAFAARLVQRTEN